MTGHSKITFIPAFQLKVGDILALPSLKLKQRKNFSIKMRTHHLSPVKAEIPLTPKLMKVFGFYISEGSTWKKEIKFTVNSKEKKYIDEITKIIKKYFGVSTKIKERTENCIKTRTTCSALADYLRDTFGGYVHKKKIPYQWLALPKKYLTELVQGVWYGDGSKSCSKFCLGTTSRELFNFMKLLMLKFQIAFSTKEYSPRVDKNGVNHKRAYHLIIGNPSYIKKMNLVLPNMKISLKRKGRRTIWFEKDKMLYHIKKITEIPYQGQVFNLEVENANSYMLEGGVVHNCFPRDSRAFYAFGKRYGIKSELAKATDKINQFQIKHLVNKILDIISSLKEKSVAVLGLSYKPKTPVIEESPSIELIKEFLKRKLRVIVYDPLAMGNTKKIFGDKILYASSVRNCFSLTSLCIIATPDKEFQKINKGYIKHNPTTIIDCWRIINPARLSKKINYISIGRFQNEVNRKS